MSAAEDTAEHAPAVEAFIDDVSGAPGWQCYSCDAEAVGYRTLGRAETAAARHRCGETESTG